MTTRTDLLFTTLIDAACLHCRVRDRFWRDVKERGVIYAMDRLALSDVNVEWYNKAKQRLKDESLGD